jgi:hypothetical protein
MSTFVKLRLCRHTESTLAASLSTFCNCSQGATSSDFKVCLDSEAILLSTADSGANRTSPRCLLNWLRVSVDLILRKIYQRVAHVYYPIVDTDV